jgi:hypothetical protein
MTWRPFVALMVLLTLFCVAGPHAHADTPRPAGVSSCDGGAHPHRHAASCDAPAAQSQAADLPPLGDQGRCGPVSATPAGLAPAPAPPARPDLLALLCLARV